MKSLIFLILTTYSMVTIGAVSETTLLAKILGQSVAQLKELKEIWEINKSTLSELETANRKVQQTRYQILRTKYILDSAKTLHQTNFQNPQDAINYMRKAKNLGKSTGNLFDDIKSLSKEEREVLAREINKADEESLTIQDKIFEAKASLLNNKLNSVRLRDHENQIQKYDALTEINEDVASSNIDSTTAQVETAKNTSIANRLILQNSQINSAQLMETYKMTNLLEESRLEQLKKQEQTERIWKINKE